MKHSDSELTEYGEIINSDAGNIMIEPDFNYEILSGADNIDIEEVEDNRTNGKGNWLDIKGVKAGTAVNCSLPIML